MKKKDKVVAIVHYNTQELTAAAIRSLEKHTPGTQILVFDNSDKTPFDAAGIEADVQIIDNTQGQLINFNRWLAAFPDKQPDPAGYGSAKHCLSVQWLFDHRRRHFVLMDSDVIVKSDISPLWDEAVAWKGVVENHRSRFGTVRRVHPCLCYINMPMIHEAGVTYFNRDKMFALSADKPANAYDTGCWFLEDCERHNLPGVAIDLADYAEHMRSGSWKRKGAKAVAEWLEKNKEHWK